MFLNCGVGEDSWVPWTARRLNQSILKEVSPKFSLEGLMLKLQSFGHLTRRTASFEKILMLAKTEGRRRGRQRWLDASPIDEHEFEQALGVGDEQRGLGCYSTWGCKGSDMTEQLNWTDQQNMWLEMRKSSKNEGQFFTWSTGCHTLSQKEQTKAFLSWSWEDCGPNWRCPKGIWINLLLRRKTWARTECENR